MLLVTDQYAAMPNAHASKSTQVYTDVVDYTSVYKALETAGFPVNGEESGLVYLPMAPVECEDDVYLQNSDLYDRILAVDDVDSVYSSCDGLH